MASRKLVFLRDAPDANRKPLHYKQKFSDLIYTTD